MRDALLKTGRAGAHAWRRGVLVGGAAATLAVFLATGSADGNSPRDSPSAGGAAAVQVSVDTTRDSNEGATCAVLVGGSVDCWGASAVGQLGDNQDIGPSVCEGEPCSQTPVGVSGLTDATEVASGGLDVCAVVTTGGIYCWGGNESGNLGTGSITGPQRCRGYGGLSRPCSMTPVPVAGISDATEVALGEDFACALVAGGRVVCWGSATGGELGDGSAPVPASCLCSAAPVPVSGLTGVTEISAGGDDACALLAGGAIDCWGDNSTGALGDSLSSQSLSRTPVSVSGITNAKQVSVGDRGACAVLAGGAVECWGDNSYGELAQPSDPEVAADYNCLSNDYFSCSVNPVEVAQITNATQVTYGAATCALLTTQHVDCWGQGLLGDGRQHRNEGCGFLSVGGGGPAPLCADTPVEVAGISTATQLADECAVLSGGSVDCWGRVPKQVPLADAAMCVVPALELSRLTTYRRDLSPAGCSVGNIRYQAPPVHLGEHVGKGIVLSTSPRPGSVRARGTRIELVVSLG